MCTEEVSRLKKMAAKIRIHVIEEIFRANSGHPGGSLSIAEVLSVLYFYKMNIYPENPNQPDRDRFILSKGHAAPAYYAALAERGFFNTKELLKLRQLGSFLQGHPDMRKVPGVDMSTGSLGQGLSVANGMAMVGKCEKMGYSVYAVIGDGELEEGQIWEAAMTAAHYKLGNLTVFIDHNGLQIDGPITKVMSPEPIKEKFIAFGWNVLEINGHDVEQIIGAVNSSQKNTDKPTVIICKTTKGKGVSFMENQVKWHGKSLSQEQYEIAIREQEETLQRLEGR